MRSGRGAKRRSEAGWEAKLDALNRILRGMVKKFVLAELLGSWIIDPSLSLETMSRPELLGRSYAFYLFLYCDFSGYCDVMIGVGSLMGVRPPENFNLPFFSRNVSEYWLRVHRSLTQWLTDYLFNPSYAALLRMRDRFGSPLVALALAQVFTMLIAGVWHGTTFSFVCFGLVHGVFLAVHRCYESLMTGRLGRRGFREFSAQRWVRIAGIALTYNLTSLAYLFFVLEPARVWHVLTRILGC